MTNCKVSKFEMKQSKHSMKQIKLESKGLSCSVDPENGGQIIGLSIQGEEIFKSKEKKNPVEPSVGLVALIPCVHHASLRELVWHGTGHPMLNHQLNAEQFDWGLGWQSQWQILEQEDDFVLLSLEHRAEKKWPWLFDASQVIRLHEETLFLTLSLTNQSKVSAPAGLGWAIHLPAKQMDQVTINAKKESSINHLAVKEGSREETEGGNTNISEGFDGAYRMLKEAKAYGEWDGEASLRTDRYRLVLRSTLQTLQAWPSPEHDFLMLKALDVPFDVMKQTAPPQMLAPGESMSIEMSVKIDLRKID